MRITTHEETPDAKGTNDVNGGGLTGDSLTKGGNDNDHKLNTIWNGPPVSKG